MICVYFLETIISCRLVIWRPFFFVIMLIQSPFASLFVGVQARISPQSYHHHHFETCSTALLASSSSSSLMSQEEEDRLSQLKSFLEEHQRIGISCLPQKEEMDSSGADTNNQNNIATTPRSITGSRFGGRYAWPKHNPDLPLPVPACCLVQINLAEIPADYVEQCNQELSTKIPETGLLQVFIQADYISMGRKDPDGVRVVFHDGTNDPEFELQPPVNDYDDLETDLNLFDLEEINPDWLPFGRKSYDRLTTTGIPMTFRLEPKLAPTLWDYRAAKIVGLATAEDYDWYIQSSDEYKDRVQQLEDNHPFNAPCWLFGHSHFTQDDPRGYPRIKDTWKDDYESFISFSSCDEDVYMWGDCGTARIFLPNAGRQAFQDFSKAEFSWDCC